MIIASILVVLVYSCCIADSRINETEIPYPVVLLPGLAGSQLQARLNRTETKYWYCQKKSDWYRIWQNPQSVMPFAINCFIENMKMVYNSTTGRTHNVEGVETRVEDFGNVTSIEYFMNFQTPMAGYYHNLIRALEVRGYKRGISLRGAPFEFRKGPYESEEHFDNMKKLVEETYDMNGGKRVVIVCHSNGCTYNYHFLLRSSSEWKKKYIQSWVTLGSPLGGSVEALEAVVTGNAFHFGMYSQNLLHDLERTWSSIAPIIPVASVFGNMTILSIGDVNYTANDMPFIFDLMNDTVGAAMWRKSVEILSDDIPWPGVEIHCIRSQGLPTLQSLSFPSMKSFPKSPKLVNGEGDGTVNKVSSDLCLRWQNQPDFHTIEYDSKVNHITLATSPLTIDYLLTQVLHIQ